MKRFVAIAMSGAVFVLCGCRANDVSAEPGDHLVSAQAPVAEAPPEETTSPAPSLGEPWGEQPMETAGPVE